MLFLLMLEFQVLTVLKKLHHTVYQNKMKNFEKKLQNILSSLVGISINELEEKKCRLVQYIFIFLLEVVGVKGAVAGKGTGPGTVAGTGTGVEMGNDPGADTENVRQIDIIMKCSISYFHIMKV